MGNRAVWGKGLAVIPVACVASVSSRVRRESWDESKKRGLTGEGEGNKFLLDACYAGYHPSTFLHRCNLGC